MLSPEIADTLLNPGNANIKPGLERMHAVLDQLTNPQNNYKVIHITGTNGKGSTAAFIATGLIHAGFKVGKFMSPHIVRINECITINNQEIHDEDIERIYFIIEEINKAYTVEPSPFELLTLIMFYYMAEQKVDYLVLEAGMGGATDCTNVVDSIYSIITNVALEHTKWLGNTLEDIAKNKAGIIKNGKTIIADNGIELLNAVKNKTTNYVNVLDKYQLELDLDDKNFKTMVIISLRAYGSRNKSGMTGFDTESTKINEQESIIKLGVTDIFQRRLETFKADIDSIEKTSVISAVSFQRRLESIQRFTLGLYGEFQAYNFLIAYEVLNDIGVKEESVVYAAEHAFIPYRMQIMSQEPLVIFDIAHNLAGVKALVKSLLSFQRTLESIKRSIMHYAAKSENEINILSATIPRKLDKKYNKDHTVVVTAILVDKDIRAMLEIFSQIANNIVFTSIKDNPRAVSASELSKYADGLFKQQYTIDDPKEALRFVKSRWQIVIAAGSSYLFKSLV